MNKTSRLRINPKPYQQKDNFSSQFPYSEKPNQQKHSNETSNQQENISKLIYQPQNKNHLLNQPKTQITSLNQMNNQTNVYNQKSSLSFDPNQISQHEKYNQMIAPLKSTLNNQFSNVNNSSNPYQTLPPKSEIDNPLKKLHEIPQQIVKPSEDLTNKQLLQNNEKEVKIPKSLNDIYTSRNGISNTNSKQSKTSPNENEKMKIINIRKQQEEKMKMKLLKRKQ